MEQLRLNLCLPCGSVVKNLPAVQGAMGDVGLIPWLGRSPGGGHGNALQYSCWENSTDRVAWWASVQGLQRVRYDSAIEQACTEANECSIGRYLGFFSAFFLLDFVLLMSFYSSG